jgi:hypothetical protein
VILEGTYFGAHGSTNIINQLIPITTYSIGGIDFLCFNFQFFTGLKRVLLWDYSFYTGGFQILRWLWLTIFTPPVAWGIWSATAPIISTFFSRILGIL